MLDYVVRSACRAFHDLAQQRGGDPVEHTALFEQTLDVAAPAYGRVCAAVLDLWFTAALDALPTSAWCVIKPLLESCVEIIRGLAQYAGCEPEQMLTTYWISLENARA